MTFFRKLTALCLAALLLQPLALPAHSATDSPKDLVQRIVNYYHYYQEDAALDYELILEQLRSQDPALADAWSNILAFWSGINRTEAVNSNVLPEGLPEDDSLCIMVMGYQLESDGGMRPELEDRMRVTLASALKYPNAYILCTGGGTASKNSKVTEAGKMASWLRRNGIDSSRIIVEDNALSTVQNAIYGCQLLYRDYPQVRSLAVITSDYHIYRSCLYVHAQAVLEAYNLGIQPMQVISNATCQINPDAAPDLDTQVRGIGLLTGMDKIERMDQPWLTYLDHLQVSGATEYALGTELNLQVTAVYSNGYSRDVTARCNYTGYDFGQSGFQTVTVQYEEGSALQTASLDVYVVPPDGTPAPTRPQPTTPLPEVSLPEDSQESPAIPAALLVGAAAGLVLLVVLLQIKAKQKKKRRRKRQPMNLQ